MRPSIRRVLLECQRLKLIMRMMMEGEGDVDSEQVAPELMNVHGHYLKRGGHLLYSSILGQEKKTLANLVNKINDDDAKVNPGTCYVENEIFRPKRNPEKQ